MKFKVSTAYAGTRLDVFLHAHFLDFSRSWIQKLIKNGKATVNNKKTIPSRKLTTSDVVIFEPELPPEISLEPDPNLNSKIKIVFEDEDFLVIDKPSGLSAHPSSSEPKGTIVNWLLWKDPKIKSVGDPISYKPSFQSSQAEKLRATNYSVRPGIVHRLDKDTSGLIVIAKNQPIFEWLKLEFKNHRVTKRYFALVNGNIEKENGQIDLNIRRSRSDPTKNTTTVSKTTGRPALTYWRVIKKYPNYTLLEITPKTGRMHQIRVHLKAIGHPVAGDKKYGRQTSPLHLGRMFLHATYLSFRSPSGEKFSFHAPLPEELERALQNLPFVVK